LLRWIDDDRDDDLIEQLAPALDDVEMAVRHGVEGAGIDGASHIREESVLSKLESRKEISTAASGRTMRRLLPCSVSAPVNELGSSLQRKTTTHFHSPRYENGFSPEKQVRDLAVPVRRRGEGTA